MGLFSRLKRKSKEQASTQEQQVSQTVVEEAPISAPEPVEVSQPEPVEPDQSFENKQPGELPVEWVEAEPPAQAKPVEKIGFFSRIKQGLSKTRQSFGGGLSRLFLGKKSIDDELFEEIETILLSADVGIDATTEIIDALTAETSRRSLKDPNELMGALKTKLMELLEPVNKPLVIPQSSAPYVILMVGVNGAGKTTTIGKLANQFKSQGKKVMLAAGDTFRAAAVEQLQVWGERNNIEVVAQHTGADSASVIFDAIEKGKARGVDVVIADTAGRLHNKQNLMNELEKIIRVMKKFDAAAPHETMLVVDAGNGQNALSQAVEFNKTAELSGITVTKLDGTAKGGIIFAIAKALNTPIRFIGVGEGIEDLRPFEHEGFVEALFD